MLAIVLVICLAPLFSGEWRDRTSATILTTCRGQKDDAIAKIAVGFCFTLELFLVIAISYICVQIVYLGTEGWNTPIQCIKMIAIAPMNMLQAELYEYLFTLIGLIGFAGLVMLISSISKNDILSLIGGFSLLFIPMIISGNLPYKLQLIISLIPLAGSASDIFRTDTLNIFGKVICLPYMELLVPILFGVACIPITIRQWAKIQKT